MRRFTLEPRKWYAWQMLPGYVNHPYHSPILVHDVQPLGTGAGLFQLHFYNAFYAEGVRDFKLTIQTLNRQREYTVGVISYNDKPNDRTCIIHAVTFDWLEANARYMMDRERPNKQEIHSPSGVQVYLRRVLMGKETF